ncbi:hypothetical protein CGMCC3_g5008 [Colletotrichum fructicola]|nr:uncharacterized protein CGMCC3_g5008 [Colletotrichum fructicola]KAE9578893.1 hypothetical protein CGMCC3_g5008 [Colletotrichum fructicola]
MFYDYNAARMIRVQPEPTPAPALHPAHYLIISLPRTSQHHIPRRA